MSYTVVALYKFLEIQDPGSVQESLSRFCAQHGLCGALLIADEGINGTLAGDSAAIDALIQHLRDLFGLEALDYKLSSSETKPFNRMKVKLKAEIVTLGVPGVDPTKCVGQYVEPEDWNELIARDDVILIDARNDFEVRVGTFRGAVNPHTESFGDFPAYVRDELEPAQHAHVAMFCTGGIRCEKASSYMLDVGFENVYHLRGGILRYLEQIPEDRSSWQGECFVFDRRVSIKHGLEEGSFELCFGCQNPLSLEDRKHREYEKGVACSFCSDTLTHEHRKASRERLKQIRLARERGDEHMGELAEEMERRRDLKKADKVASRARSKPSSAGVAEAQKQQA